MKDKTENAIQTSLFAPTSCVFTGHRDLGKDFRKSALKKETEIAIKKGVKKFYCGLALGFDLTACEVVLDLKKKYKDVQLIGCIPCLEQSKFFPAEEKKRYYKIIEKLDERILVSDALYYKGCMHKRNEYMCDNADMMIAYCKVNTGGTAYTVNYFTKKYPQRPVIFL